MTKSRLLAGDFDLSLEYSINLSQGFDKTCSRPQTEIAIYSYLHASDINPIDVGAFLRYSRNQMVSSSSVNDSSANKALLLGFRSHLSASDDSSFAHVQIAPRTKQTLEVSATLKTRNFNSELCVGSEDGATQSISGSD